MSLLYIIFPIALLIAAGFVFAFVWATRRGQFDDLDTPSMRMLGEDEEASVEETKQARNGDLEES